MPLVRKDKSPAPEGATPPKSDAGLMSAVAAERWSAARALTSPADVMNLAKALQTETDTSVREAIFTSLSRIATLESAKAVA
ncbi:MAG: hypothetical protein ABWZ40_13160, partial [Caulobacterales bacterium]